MLNDRFDVRAVFNPTVRLAENIASEFQADVVDGFRAMVSRCDIDAVMVLQQTWLKQLPIVAAARCGKAIYWADGYDLSTVADAGLIKHFEDSGVSMMIELPYRFAAATLRLKELIATRIGTPELIICHRNVDPDDHVEWLQLIDWCRYIAGIDDATVTSRAHRDSSGESLYRNLVIVDRRQNASVHIYGGRHLSRHALGAECAVAATHQTPSSLQVICQNGVAFIDPPHSLVWFDRGGRTIESLDTEMPIGQLLLSQFHRRVTGLLRNVTDINDLHASAKILTAATRCEAAT